MLRVFTYLFLGLSCFYTFNAFAAPTDNDHGLYLGWIDKNINPSKNFYGYANGNWQKNNPIPPAYARWTVFHGSEKHNEEILRGILESTAKNAQQKVSSINQKIGDFYYSGMDEKTIERLGITPIKPEFERIHHIRDKTELQQMIAHLQMLGANVLFNFGQQQDFKNSQKVIGVATQGGLGLPDRDYYLKTDEKFKQIRQAYLQHVTNMFKLLGDNASQAMLNADTVLKIETFLAQASMPLSDQRNPYAVYHILNLEKLHRLTPHFSWKNYFSNLNHPEIKSINTAMPNFFTAMDKALTVIPLEDWKTYLRWHLIQRTAPYLSTPFVNESFQLTTVLTGSKELLPRWQRVVKEEDEALGFAVGKLYVEKMFPPSSKETVTEMIQHIHNALELDLKTLSWMTPKTRQLALKKLALMKSRVGYPDKWRDYSAFTVIRGPYIQNVLSATLFLNKRELNKIGKPVDLSEWEMTPQTVNAYYDPSTNTLNIPAGFLQPPFFDPNAPDAANYGAIGFVIGHEMTHGFDDEGAQFDGYGNLKNWWTPEDLKKFQAATECIIHQFSQYKVDGNVFIQGKLVAGEAIADLGGFILAYRAFHASPSFQQAKTIAGYTPDQQFFLSGAHTFAGNIRPEEARRLATIDPHPPMNYRINGSLANMPQFQTAYNVPANSPMVNKKRCVIW